MNRQQYRGKKDTPYYGASFGLGLGAVGALLLAAIAAGAIENSPQEVSTFVFYAVLIQLTIGSVLLRSAMAVIISRSALEGMPFSGLIKGLLVLVPFTLLVGVALFVDAFREGPFSIFFPTGALLYAIAAAHYQRKKLDNIVPDELAQQVRREMRKQMRPGTGDLPDEPPRPPASP
jgi:hypothetical protein